MKAVFRLGLVITAIGALCSATTNANAGTTTYKYDTLGRVIEVDYPDGSWVKYAYDKAGNRIQTDRHAGP